MTELTKEQKLYVINEMIRYYKNVKGKCIGMCAILTGILERDLEQYTYLDSFNAEKLLFPEFYIYAKKEQRWWFPYGESKPRLAYCKKIKLLLEGK